MDRALRLYPTVEHCSSGVCRRTLFMYGEVVHHQQLDRHTHDMMYDMFDRANLAAFDHLTRMTRAGRIVDRHGRNVYLSEANAEPLTMPITLVQGMKNRLFRPSGAKKTEAWLKKNIGAQNRVNLVPCSDYAHLDVFIGKNAAIETFPLIVKALNRTA